MENDPQDNRFHLSYNSRKFGKNRYFKLINKNKILITPT